MSSGVQTHDIADRVDVSLPVLLSENRSGREAYLLLARAARTDTGRNALHLAEPCNAWPRVVNGRLSISRIKDGAIWSGNEITVDGKIPETLLAAMVGRRAESVIDHPACVGRTISSAWVDAGRTTVALEEQDVLIDDLPGATSCTRFALFCRIAADLTVEWTMERLPFIFGIVVGACMATALVAIMIFLSR